MSILAEKAAALRNGLIDVLLPQDCLLCSAPSGRALICTDCADALPRLTPPACPRCAQPGGAGETCGRCLRHPPHFDRLIAVFPYTFPIDRMVQRLKYGHQLALADWFGRQLAAACADVAADLIVPMPLHPKRMAERGFNQAAEIARPLAQALVSHARHHQSAARAAPTASPALWHGCERVRQTTPQEGLTLRERRRNLRGAFACTADIASRHVLLIDDVVTTGASADECARTLKLHGAAQVTVAAVARTLRR